MVPNKFWNWLLQRYIHLGISFKGLFSFRKENGDFRSVAYFFNFHWTANVNSSFILPQFIGYKSLDDDDWTAKATFVYTVSILLLFKIRNWQTKQVYMLYGVCIISKLIFPSLFQIYTFLLFYEFIILVRAYDYDVLSKMGCPRGYGLKIPNSPPGFKSDVSKLRFLWKYTETLWRASWHKLYLVRT